MGYYHRQNTKLAWTKCYFHFLLHKLLTFPDDAEWGNLDVFVALIVGFS